MKLEGLHLIDIAFNHWLKKYNFTCRTNGVAEDFFWLIDPDEIRWTLFLNKESLTTWANLLNELGLNYDIDPFYTVFLHEVFHSETYWYISEEEIEMSEFEKLAMERDPSSYDNIYNVYYHLPVEIEATAAAVNYINTYPERVKELVDLVGKAVRLFYKINNVVDEDSFDF